MNHPTNTYCTRGLMTGLIALSLLATAYGQQPAATIVGEWLSTKKDSRIAIYQQGTIYAGKIVWGLGQATTDEKNPDPALRNRKRIGLVMLTTSYMKGPRPGKTVRSMTPAKARLMPAK